MRKMEVEIISQELVKPSFHTPDHLKIFKMSFLDQLTGSYPVRLISFFPRMDKGFKINEAINQLKISLSQTLTHYYPLAGIPRDDSSMECNDQGALFITSHVQCSMKDLLDQPNFVQFHKLGNSSQFFGDGSSQVSVQFNVFSCGGVAVFFSFSHRIVDMQSFATFLRCWASYSCGYEESRSYPEYKLSTIFPPREYIPYHFSVVPMGLKLTQGRGIRKRFVFSPTAVSLLKTKGSSNHVREPTSVEVVSSFIWKRAMEAAKTVKGVQQPSMLVHSVDIRRRMVPPLPDYSLGNFIWLMVAEYGGGTSDDESEIEFEGLVKKLRLAKRKTEDEVVPKILGSEKYDEMNKFLKDVGEKCGNKDLNVYQFSSWCKMGLNEVDFGWGKPVWTSMVGGTEAESIYKNFVILIDGSDGGIEAWLILEQSEMAVLEADQDFLAFASPNPGFIIS